MGIVRHFVFYTLISYLQSLRFYIIFKDIQEFSEVEWYLLLSPTQNKGMFTTLDLQNAVNNKLVVIHILLEMESCLSCVCDVICNVLWRQLSMDHWRIQDIQFTLSPKWIESCRTQKTTANNIDYYLYTYHIKI